MKNPFLATIAPYLMIGVMLVVFILSLFVFSYVLIFALVVGLVLFVVQTIRARWLKPKRPGTPQQHQGRIIDQ